MRIVILGFRAGGVAAAETNPRFRRRARSGFARQLPARAWSRIMVCIAAQGANADVALVALSAYLAFGLAQVSVCGNIAAERRMADELPARWEGEEIKVTGIVSGFPPSINPIAARALPSTSSA